MVTTWNNRVLNNALSAFKTRQRYKYDLYEFFENVKEKENLTEDLLESKKENTRKRA